MARLPQTRLAWLERICLSVLCAAALLFPSGGAAAREGGPVAQTGSGQVRGERSAEVCRFLGIPYASPPVGALRWRAPEPPAPWGGVRDADAFGPPCPQPGPLAEASREDCLTLNVWTPAPVQGSRLPVMVWIHGGGFNFGATSQPEYEGSNLAGQGVVVVSLNYRLGPMGFLAHPGLSAEQGGSSGNYGLMDQIAALEWVRRNIASFGGDPDRVTLFGQSAGSRSVSLLSLSPAARGLFRRAIAQSGGPIVGSEYLTPAFNGDGNAVRAMGAELSRRLGCAGTGDEPACMRARTAAEVVLAADCKTSIFEDGLFFAPVFEGRVLPAGPAAALAAGFPSGFALIAGSTGNEGAAYLRGETDLTRAKYESFLKARFGAQAAEALAVFPDTGRGGVYGAIDRLITVAVNAQPARLMSRQAQAGGSRAYLFHFIRRPDTPRARELGAFHGVDLAYVFGNMKGSDGYSERDRELSRQMMAYWVNFAATGDPNGPGLPLWPAYVPDTDRSLEIGDAIAVRQGLYRRECDFIDAVSRFRPEAGPVPAQ